jgi:hypothetical protein
MKKSKLRELMKERELDAKPEENASNEKQDAKVQVTKKKTTKRSK